MKAALLVFVGGGIGSLLRFAVQELARLWLAAAFPWGTLAVNVAGGVVAGLLAATLLTRDAASSASLFLMTGLLGGFTTFSAFSLEAVQLWNRGEVSAAAAYVFASLFLSIAGVAAGMSAARLLS